jgi:hypothetical protein
MTLIYSMIIFLVIWFNVYYDYMLSIARLSLYSSMELYSAHLGVHWVGGKHGVGMVLISCFPAIATYIPGHVVDRGCDTPIESFVVHSPSIGSVELYYSGRLALFLIFLSNVHHV